MFDDRIDPPQTVVTPPAAVTPESGVQGPSAQETVTASPALARFAVCRWTHRGQGNGATHCTHPEVLPFAGAHGFTPESWCGDCEFFKVKRVARKNYDQA